MNQRFAHSFKYVVIATFLLVSLGCGFIDFGALFGVGDTPVPTLPATTVAFPTSAPQKTIAVQPTTAPQKTGAVQSTLPPQATQSGQTQGGNINIQDLNQGLNALDSYHMAMTMTITGTDDKGGAVSQSLNIKQEILRLKKNSHLVMLMDGTNVPAEASNMEFFTIDGTSYIVTTLKGQKPSCFSFSGGDDANSGDLLSPSDLINSIDSATLVARGETVNGIKADHYQLKDAKLGFEGVTTSEKGEVWLSQTGNYLVRFTGEALGTFTISNLKINNGKIVWTYDLLDINKTFTLTPPDSCAAQAGGSDDYPMPANATKKSKLGTLTTFESPDTTAKVAEFYRTEAVAQGWKLVGDNKLDTIYTLTLQKGTVKINVLITPGSATGSSVIITTE